MVKNLQLPHRLSKWTPRSRIIASENTKSIRPIFKKIDETSLQYSPVRICCGFLAPNLFMVWNDGPIKGFEHIGANPSIMSINTIKQTSTTDMMKDADGNWICSWTFLEEAWIGRPVSMDKSIIVLPSFSSWIVICSLSCLILLSCSHSKGSFSSKW